MLCSYGISTCSGSLTRALPLAIWPNYLQMFSKKVLWFCFFLPFFTCVPCDMHVSVAWVCVCWCVCMWHACVCVHGLVCADMCVSDMHMSMCMSLYMVICVHEALMCPCALVYISVKLYCIAQLCSRHNQCWGWGRAGLGTEITDLTFLWRWTLAFRFIHTPS